MKFPRSEDLGHPHATRRTGALREWRGRRHARLKAGHATRRDERAWHRNGHATRRTGMACERGWHATVVRRERGYVSRRIVRAFGRLIRFGFGECLMVTQRDE
jgi:hypothetical protein